MDKIPAKPRYTEMEVSSEDDILETYKGACDLCGGKDTAYMRVGSMHVLGVYCTFNWVYACNNCRNTITQAFIKCCKNKEANQ